MRLTTDDYSPRLDWPLYVYLLMFILMEVWLTWQGIAFVAAGASVDGIVVRGF